MSNGFIYLRDTRTPSQRQQLDLVPFLGTSLARRKHHTPLTLALVLHGQLIGVPEANFFMLDNVNHVYSLICCLLSCLEASNYELMGDYFKQRRYGLNVPNGTFISILCSYISIASSFRSIENSGRHKFYITEAFFVQNHRNSAEYISKVVSPSRLYRCIHTDSHSKVIS